MYFISYIYMIDYELFIIYKYLLYYLLYVQKY